MAVAGKRSAKERSERRRKIEAIRFDAERRKRELAGGAPSVPRGPRFYLVLIVLFSGMLFVALNFSTRPTLKNGQVTGTASNINLLAEALGRFRFHTGVYPTTEQGLEALTWTETGRIPGYNGPYLMNRIVPRDAWKHPYRYVGPGDDLSNPLPTLASAGPDGRFGTADDMHPDPDSFYRAGRDVSWTNEWVPYSQRGIKILSKEQKAAVLAAEARRRARAEAEAGAAAERPQSQTEERK